MKNLDKYKNLLQNGEVDGLFLTSETNRFYAAEFNVSEGAAVITKNQCYYFTDSRYIEVAEKNLPGFTVLMVDKDHSYTQQVNDVISAHGLKTLGFEENYLTYAEYMHYNQNLNAELIPYQKSISAFRDIKEPWELDYMRKAQDITDKTFSDMCKIVKPGMTEKELAAELIYRLSKNGADGPSFDPIVVTGANTSMPHGVPGDTVVKKGDFVTMDFGATYRGYCSDMTRTVAIGYATEEMKKVYNIVLEAQMAALAITKAGVPGKEIDGTARKIITDAGYGPYFGHGYGHGIGIEIHESPSPNPSNPNGIPAGAVCSAEPGIYLPDKFGVRIEDVVIFTEDGHENITHSPKNLIIL